jgi:hypothetical protein
MKILPLIITILFLSSCSIFSNKNTVGEFPIYGNWCGPKHPAEGTNPIPIDNTDAACKAHDLCYDYNGYLDRHCDDALVAELKSFFPESEIEASFRKAIISYFKRSPKL